MTQARTLREEETHAAAASHEAAGDATEDPFSPADAVFAESSRQLGSSQPRDSGQCASLAAEASVGRGSRVATEGAESRLQQPLLPPDGPLLSQQHSSQQALAGLQSHDPTAAAGEQGQSGQAGEVQPLQHWISMLGQMPSGHGSFQASLNPLAPSTFASQFAAPDVRLQRSAATEQHTSPRIQSTGAFAPLRPAQAGSDGPFPSALLREAPQDGALGHQAGFGGFSPHVPDGLHWGSQGLVSSTDGPDAHLPHTAYGQQSYSEQAGLDGSAAYAHQHGHDAAGPDQLAFPEPQPGRGEPTRQLAHPAPPHRLPQATKSSRFRGVYKRQRGGRWEASIVHEGKNVRLGLHLTEVAAARAYDRVALKKWGPDQGADKINFPLDQYDMEELDALSMGDLVQAIRTEWRTKQPASGTSPSEQPGHDRTGAEAAGGGGVASPPAEAAGQAEPPTKRQRPREFEAAGLAATDGDGQAEETHGRVPVKRSSMFRGVSTHKQSGKWVAQIKAGGKQVYLGFYTSESEAARAYDQAVVHMQGEQAETNFALEDYFDRIEELQGMDFADLVALLKQQGRGGVARQPKGVSSRFRGVAPDKGRKWRSQITTGARTTVYLGLWADEEGAARAYDRASIAKRGSLAKTNFPLDHYHGDMEQLQLIPFEMLIAQLRSEATASVAALKAAKFDLVGPPSILSPPQPIEAPSADHVRYLQLETAHGPVSSYKSGLEADGQPHFSPAGAGAAAFQIGGAQVGRFSAGGGLGMAQGYLIGRQAAPPDMLFRVVSRGGEDGSHGYAP